ncbi:hypothetical protein CW304_16880 [Bacillus sp. UFRGS-B20]|nr:hypothetical protein CW304_16880 [Bacillus sp. UFRGS-B20]
MLCPHACGQQTWRLHSFLKMLLNVPNATPKAPILKPTNSNELQTTPINRCNSGIARTIHLNGHCLFHSVRKCIESIHKFL